VKANNAPKSQLPTQLWCSLVSANIPWQTTYLPGAGAYYLR